MIGRWGETMRDEYMEDDGSTSTAYGRPKAAARIDNIALWGPNNSIQQYKHIINTCSSPTCIACKRSNKAEAAGLRISIPSMMMIRCTEHVRRHAAYACLAHTARTTPISPISNTAHEDRNGT